MPNKKVVSKSKSKKVVKATAKKHKLIAIVKKATAPMTTIFKNSEWKIAKQGKTIILTAIRKIVRVRDAYYSVDIKDLFFYDIAIPSGPFIAPVGVKSMSPESDTNYLMLLSGPDIQMRLLLETTGDNYDGVRIQVLKKAANLGNETLKIKLNANEFYSLANALKEHMESKVIDSPATEEESEPEESKSKPEGIIADSDSLVVSSPSANSPTVFLGIRPEDVRVRPNYFSFDLPKEMAQSILGSFLNETPEHFAMLHYKTLTKQPSLCGSGMQYWTGKSDTFRCRSYNGNLLRIHLLRKAMQEGEDTASLQMDKEEFLRVLSAGLYC